MTQFNELLRAIRHGESPSPASPSALVELLLNLDMRLLALEGVYCDPPVVPKRKRKRKLQYAQEIE